MSTGPGGGEHGDEHDGPSEGQPLPRWNLEDEGIRASEDLADRMDRLAAERLRRLDEQDEARARLEHALGTDAADLAVERGQAHAQDPGTEVLGPTAHDAAQEDGEDRAAATMRERFRGTLQGNFEALGEQARVARATIGAVARATGEQVRVAGTAAAPAASAAARVAGNTLNVIGTNPVEAGVRRFREHFADVDRVNPAEQRLEGADQLAPPHSSGTEELHPFEHPPDRVPVEGEEPFTLEPARPRPYRTSGVGPDSNVSRGDRAYMPEMPQTGRSTNGQPEATPTGPGSGSAAAEAAAQPPEAPPQSSAPERPAVELSSERQEQITALDAAWSAVMNPETTTLEERQQSAADMLRDAISRGSLRPVGNVNVGNPHNLAAVDAEGRGLLRALAAAEQGLIRTNSQKLSPERWSNDYEAKADWQQVHLGEYIQGELDRQAATDAITMTEDERYRYGNQIEARLNGVLTTVQNERQAAETHLKNQLEQARLKLEAEFGEDLAAATEPEPEPKPEPKPDRAKSKDKSKDKDEADEDEQPAKEPKPPSMYQETPADVRRRRESEDDYIEAKAVHDRTVKLAYERFDRQAISTYDILMRYQAIADEADAAGFLVDVTINGQTEQWPIMNRSSEKVAQRLRQLRAVQETKLHAEIQDRLKDPVFGVVENHDLGTQDESGAIDIMPEDIEDPVPHDDIIDVDWVEYADPADFEHEPGIDTVRAEIDTRAPDGTSREVAVITEYDRTMNDLVINFGSQLKEIMDESRNGVPDAEAVNARLQQLEAQAGEHHFVHLQTNPDGTFRSLPRVSENDPGVFDSRSYALLKGLRDARRIASTVNVARPEYDADRYRSVVETEPGMFETLQIEYNDRLSDIQTWIDDANTDTDFKMMQQALYQLSLDAEQDGFVRLDGETGMVKPVAMIRAEPLKDRSEAMTKEVLDGRSDAFARAFDAQKQRLAETIANADSLDVPEIDYPEDPYQLRQVSQTELAQLLAYMGGDKPVADTSEADEIDWAFAEDSLQGWIDRGARAGLLQLEVGGFAPVKIAVSGGEIDDPQSYGLVADLRKVQARLQEYHDLMAAQQSATVTAEGRAAPKRRNKKRRG